MRYEAKKRRERYWEIDPETLEPARDEDGKLRPKKRRFVERLEWVAPDGTIYRAKDPAILDRRRLAQEAEDES